MIGASMRQRGVLLVLAAMIMGGLSKAEELPAGLAVPADATVISQYSAKGVQIYACTAKSTGNEWLFKAPEAQLADPKGVVVARHYAGPTWEALDGSKIVGKLMQAAPAPIPDAIPWLLLSVKSSGQGRFAGARYVQRIKTAGGVGPSGACASIGDEQRVPYSAEYVIYR